MDGTRTPLRSPSLRPEAWDRLLAGYFDHDELVQSARYGWDLSFLEHQPAPHDAKANHPTAMLHEADVDQYIQKELQFGALVGPVQQNVPFPLFASPLASVDKKNSATTRTIVDCTQRSKNGKGINNWISAHQHRGQLWKINLPTTWHITEAIDWTRRRNPNKKIKLFKIDMARYYRYFLLCPGQTPYFAIRWKGQIYIDRSFGFGNRGAVLGAQRASYAIAWIYRTQVSPSPGVENSGINCRCTAACSCGDNSCLPYIDDLICTATEDQADHLYNSLLAIIKDLGLQPSTTPGHLVPPTEVCTALGIQFNLMLNIISIPAEKIAECQELICVWLAWTYASRRDLKKLSGKLLFCSRVIRSGRLHLNSFFDTEKRAFRLNAAVPLDANFHLDLRWWSDALLHWNGISFLQHYPVGEIAIDASTSGINDQPAVGGYNFVRDEFFKASVPPEFSDWDIPNLELLAHIVAARLWGESLSGKQVTGCTDNEATQKLLSSGRSKLDKRLVMARTFSAIQHKFDFIWIPTHIPGIENILPDACSRWDSKQSVFWQHCASLGLAPTERVLHDYHFRWTNF